VSAVTREGSRWLHEIKHDGIRIMARRDSAGVRLITRHGTDKPDESLLLVLAERALRVIVPDAYRRFPPL